MLLWFSCSGWCLRWVPCTCFKLAFKRCSAGTAGRPPAARVPSIHHQSCWKLTWLSAPFLTPTTSSCDRKFSVMAGLASASFLAVFSTPPGRINAGNKAARRLVSTSHLDASRGEVDISNHSSAGLQSRPKNKVSRVRRYLEKCLGAPQVCKTLPTSAFASLCNTFNSVSLCVDVLRGNHTATERAVITHTNSHLNWKLSAEAKERRKRGFDAAGCGPQFFPTTLTVAVVYAGPLSPHI